MDFSFPEELQALRDNVARFAEKEIAPHAQEWDRDEAYPDSLIAKLGEQGFLGIIVPEEYGGSGSGHMAFAVILEELARFDGGVALAVEAHNGLCCSHILKGGSEEQKKKHLPALASGEKMGAWCLTEPGSGTDAAALTTRATADGDHWVLNGAKQFITNGRRAGTFVVTARTSGESGGRGISAFIVEAGTPGLSTEKPEEKLGMRSSDTVTVRLDNVRVPAAQMMGAEGSGFETVKKVLEPGRVMVSAISVGLARAALEASVRYANERHSFGVPIATHQAVQAKLADMAIGVEASQLLLYKSAWMLDNGMVPRSEAPITKVFCSETATRIGMDAIQVHGGYGYLKDYNVERFMRDAKLCEIGEGTSEILRVLIARNLNDRFGLPRV